MSRIAVVATQTSRWSRRLEEIGLRTCVLTPREAAAATDVGVIVVDGGACSGAADVCIDLAGRSVPVVF